MPTAPGFAAEPSAPAAGSGAGGGLSFEALYAAYFPFVYRTLWRLGVAAECVPDAAQDVFVVVYRRIGTLHGDDVARAWVYGIVVNVARKYRRARQRGGVGGDVDPDAIADNAALSAQERAERAEAARLVDRLLDELEDERREVFVLVELEQMAVPDIASMLEANVNTIYTRLRAARADFSQALARHRARERRRP